jgi:hypothetical protein
MAPPKPTLCEADWLGSPIANPHIAAFILGRAFNRCRFHLRQAFLLFGSCIRHAARSEFTTAVEIIDQLITQDEEFATDQFEAFGSALRRVRDTWMRCFGGRKHIQFLGVLDDEMQNDEGDLYSPKWANKGLWDCRTLTAEFRDTLLGLVGAAEHDYFKLGELLYEGVRPNRLFRVSSNNIKNVLMDTGLGQPSNSTVVGEPNQEGFAS